MKFYCFLFRWARNKAKHTTGKIIYVILVSDGWDVSEFALIEFCNKFVTGYATPIQCTNHKLTSVKSDFFCPLSIFWYQCSQIISTLLTSGSSLYFSVVLLKQYAINLDCGVSNRQENLWWLLCYTQPCSLPNCIRTYKRKQLIGAWRERHVFLSTTCVSRSWALKKILSPWLLSTTNSPASVIW